MTFKKYFQTLLVLFAAFPFFFPTGLGLSADSKIYIPIGSAKTRKTVLAFPTVRTQGTNAQTSSKMIYETIVNDLTFMDIFNFVSPSAFVEDSAKSGIAPETFKFSDWTGIGAEFLIKSTLTEGSDKTWVFEAHLYDTHGAKQILAKRYLAPMKEIKTIAHTFANDVVNTLTQLPGIFLTKIAMSCDRTGKKEIYMMNFDGSEVKQVTHHRSIAILPAWNPDASRIAYSLFTRSKNNIKNIDLYEFDLVSNSVRMLSNRQGNNTGAAYNPNGKSVAFTHNFSDDSKIINLDLDPKRRQETILRKSSGTDLIETDVSWSPDGQNIAFVSSRDGPTMIYKMKADGTQVQRLTYAGRYNATPTWSPQNNKIGFAGWLSKIPDIFIMNVDGTHIERLTQNQGHNEDPHFSPDGNFITFSSNRSGQKNIYAMNIDGTFVKRLTYGLGNCTSPKWSNPSRAISLSAQPDRSP